MKRVRGARKSARTPRRSDSARWRVISLTALLLASPVEARGEADTPPRCAGHVVMHLPGAPVDRAPGVGAAWLEALGRGPGGARFLAALASVGATLRIETAVTARGAALHLELTAPATASPLIERLTDAAAASFPHASSAHGPLPPSLAASLVATAALHPPRAADADPDSAEARLVLALEGAEIAQRVGCPGPMAELPGPSALVHAGGLTTLGAAAGGDPGLARLSLVLPVPEGARPDDVGALVRWFSHPGSEFGRRLAAPPLRLGPVRAEHLATTGVVVVTAPVPAGGDLRAATHDLLRLLPALRPSAVALRGAARLAGHPAPERHLAGPLAEAMLSPDRVGVVAVAAAPAYAGEAPQLDAEARDRFVAAAVELRCPAPSDARPADVRLQDKVGLDADGWRLLAREVAADAALAAALEQETADRCGALTRLRRRVSPPLFARIYEAYRCEILGLEDEDAAFEAGRRLLAGLGLDSAWLLPIVEMSKGDPRLEKIRQDLDARCPEVVRRREGR